MSNYIVPPITDHAANVLVVVPIIRCTTRFRGRQVHDAHLYMVGSTVRYCTGGR